MHGIVTTPDRSPRPGVAVSNGRDVVITDDDGRFVLETVTPFVTISTPAGFRAERAWLPATDDERHFVLHEQLQTLPFEFLHLTDTHMTLPRGEGEAPADFVLYSEGSLPDEVRAFLASVPERAPQAQAIFITGDLVDHGLADEFEEYVRVIADSPLPVHLLPGNHDHMNGRHGGVVSRNNYLTNIGDPELYERYLGPRWYSFNIPGLHVVAMDWHTHELGIDPELQNAWVKNDLAQLPPNAPWILLFHDQPGASILDEVPWQPIAAFSGHWHTSRVVRVGETLHVNSPTTFFASLDYTPPAFRRVTWDGEQVTLATETVHNAGGLTLGDLTHATFAPTRARSDVAGSAEALLWRAALGGAGHRQRVVADGDFVFAGTQLEDEPRGAVEALHIVTGETVWSTAVGSAVKTAPAVGGDVIVVTEVSGDVHGLARETGEIVWTVPSSDPLRRFAWNPPVISGGTAFLGDQADLRAIDVATGRLLWRRTDLAPHHNLVNHAAPLIVDDLLIMGFWPTPQHPVGLNRHTGESVWEAPAQGGDLFAALKMLLIMGTASYDAAEDLALMPAFGRTAAVDRATGKIRWAVEHPGSFSPASPVVTPAGYVITATGHGVQLVDPADGALVWDLEITGEAPFPMRSYSKQPHPVVAPPTLVGDLLVLPGLDGVVRVIGLDGVVRSTLQLASPIAAALEPAGDRLLAVGTDGNLFCLSAPHLVRSATALARVAAAGGAAGVIA